MLIPVIVLALGFAHVGHVLHPLDGQDGALPVADVVEQHLLGLGATLFDHGLDAHPVHGGAFVAVDDGLGQQVGSLAPGKLVPHLRRGAAFHGVELGHHPTLDVLAVVEGGDLVAAQVAHHVGDIGLRLAQGDHAVGQLTLRAVCPAPQGAEHGPGEQTVTDRIVEARDFVAGGGHPDGDVGVVDPGEGGNLQFVATHDEVGTVAALAPEGAVEHHDGLALPALGQVGDQVVEGVALFAQQTLFVGLLGAQDHAPPVGRGGQVAREVDPQRTVAAHATPHPSHALLDVLHGGIVQGAQPIGPQAPGVAQVLVHRGGVVAGIGGIGQVLVGLVADDEGGILAGLGPGLDGLVDRGCGPLGGRGWSRLLR